MTKTFKLLGINDDVTTCECCGKSNLKKTVVLGTDSGEVHYGVNCAAYAMMGSKKAGDRKWLDAGHKPEIVARGIWNRFGYLTEVKNGAVLIGDFGEVK